MQTRHDDSKKINLGMLKINLLNNTEEEQS